MGKIYNKDSIYSLAPREFTRHTPGVYAGDTSTSTQLLIEIVSNAIDEHRLGHGNEIIVIRENNWFTVKDNGQGFLVNELREDGETVFQAAFDVMNTSGKYDEDGVYEGTSNGMYGIGDKITNFLSHNLIAITSRGGKEEILTFKEGIFQNRQIGMTKEASGTIITWNPSEEFFTNPDIDLQKAREYFHQQSALNPSLSIKFYPEGENNKGEIYHSPEGLAALITGKETSSRMVINFVEGKYKLDMLLTYTNSWSSNFIAFVNSGITDSGPHITNIKTLFTREFNKFFKSKEWGKEDKLSGDDIQNGMFCIFNITTSGHSYDAQVKTRITKIDMSPFTEVIKDKLWDWMDAHEKDIHAIYDKAITSKKAREAEKRVREKIRAATASPRNSKVKKFDSKLADCNSQNRDECSIIITEGDSASGNLKMIRDRKTIAVMPVRGKILNVEKATLEDIMDNQEIMTMMEAFGLEWDPVTLKAKIGRRGLRYGKIVIMTDADVDGAHIRILFFTFLWKICPELFDLGVVYAALPPLYKIIKGVDKFEYLEDDVALEQYRKKHEGQKYEVYRYKGLGEMSQEETKILLDPKIRRWEQITVDDVEECDQLIQTLMGTQVQPRKEYLMQYANIANINI